MSEKNIIVVKSFAFALLTIRIYKELSAKQEYVLSKQFLRSGTSVGANVRESQNAESKKDFMHKLGVSQKECDESMYWLDLLFMSNYLDEGSYSEAKSQATELLKLLKSIIVSTRKNMMEKN